MTIEELIILGKKHLHSNEAKMLLASILKYDTLELLNHLDEIISTEIADKYKTCIEAVENNIPLQYVIGNVNFFGYEFDVNKDVLIPRFETEELVDRIIKFINNKFSSAEKVIDLGCGSGAIGITLKKKIPNLDITCLDISDQALVVAQKNANKLDVEITFVKGDMLSNIDEKYDVIVSNPPYIAENEEIEDIVKDNEPHLALYAGVDGLDCYRKIFKDAKKVLNDKFLIALEIGCTQKEAIIKLANETFENVYIECFKDMSLKDRIIFIYNV